MRQLEQLAELVNGTISHHPSLEITDVSRIATATASDITFVASAKHLQRFVDSDAGAAVVCEGLDECSKPTIVVDDPESAFAVIAELFRPAPQRSATISSDAIISDSATIGSDVSIGPGAVIAEGVTIGDRCQIFANVTVLENCSIGDDTAIFPNAVLYENTVVGNRVILHSGAILGAFGFGYKTDAGKHTLSAQLGNVVIEDDVEIGANTTIDRGTFDSTVVQRGTKIDNLVMVAHNCIVGQDTLLCSQVGIAGSCNVGDQVIMAGQVGVGDHLNIGDRSIIMAKSGLMHDVPAGEAYNGIPARPARKHMQMMAAFSKLPVMRKEFKSVSRQVTSLQQEIAGDAEGDASPNSEMPADTSERNAA